jgi:hypothetical protein
VKFLCDSCERLVEPESFRVEGSELLLACPRCQAESRLSRKFAGETGARMQSPAPVSRPVVVPFAPRPEPIEAPPPTESESEVPVAVVPASERCPKCAEPKMGRSACAKCGLVFELYKPEQDAMPNSARREFAELLESGDLRKLEFVSTEQTAFLARLCRHHLADFPGDPRATAILEQLTARSLALAAAIPSSPDMETASAGKNRGALLGLAFLAVLALFAVLFSALRH